MNRRTETIKCFVLDDFVHSWLTWLSRLRLGIESWDLTNRVEISWVWELWNFKSYLYSHLVKLDISYDEHFSPILNLLNTFKCIYNTMLLVNKGESKNWNHKMLRSWWFRAFMIDMIISTSGRHRELRFDKSSRNQLSIRIMKFQVIPILPSCQTWHFLWRTLFSDFESVKHIQMHL